MNDMNFFAPLQVNKNKGNRSDLMKALLSILVAVLVIAPLAGFGYELILGARIDSMQNTLNAPANKATMDRLTALQGRVTAIEQSLPEIQKKDGLLTSAEWMTEKTLQVIIDTIPKQITVNILAMADGSVQLDGTATDKPAIAEMEYNLRKSGIADSILVSHITPNENGNYTYAINFVVKDVRTQ